jgi:ABC-2 type transport system permease protein
MNAELTGMQQTGEMLPTDYPLNIEDMLFKYGVRINPNLIVDMECARIPLNVGSQQMDLFKWYYFPLASPSTNHPISKSLDRVWFQFPSSVDTIKTRSDVKKSIVLTSSKRSRLQFAPTKLSFEILRYPADPTKFDKPNQPIAVMLEGKFPSNFDNRVTAEQLASLKNIGLNFEPLSKPTKMLVVGDGDIARNDYDALKGAMLPLGFNKIERYKFANKDFLLNTVEYMLDDNGIIEARNKDVKLRLIDTVKAKSDSALIQIVNILLPLVFLGSFGAFYYWRRRKKYAYA